MLSKLISGRRRILSALLGTSLVLSPAMLPAADSDLPETCYLFAHFYWNGDSGLHLAWSTDALHWEMLNDGESFLKPSIGESRLMRDPSLILGPDGRFHMVWTTSWAGKTIGYASSPDLIHWSEQMTIPVMAHEEGVFNCWAPEIKWDPGNEQYLIIWSSTIEGRYPETALTNRRPSRNHRIYRTTTRDFETFTPTELHYDGGYNVIDAVLEQAQGEWLMFVKHEEVSPHTEKNIRMLRAPTPYGPFSAPSAPISGGDWSEGPSILQVGNAWYLYYDQHMVDEYGCRKTTDFVTWENMDEAIEFPEYAKHGSFVAVDRDVVLRLLELENE